MKLATFQPSGAAEPVAGEVIDERVVAFGDGRSLLEVLVSGEPPRRGENSWQLSEVTLLAPMPTPRAIYGIGLNYAEHARETGAEGPERPIVFTKVPGSVAPPEGPIRCPEVVRRLDYEGELVVVMGASGRIAGYCIGDDVTGRDLQRREPQWTRAKGADTFCPYGPWVTTADEVPDPQQLRLRTWVNGDLRQDASTADMIFGCSELVEFIGETCTLMPGDLILTGTPSGVGMALEPPQFLTHGDVMQDRDRAAGRDRAQNYVVRVHTCAHPPAGTCSGRAAGTCAGGLRKCRLYADFDPAQCARDRTVLARLGRGFGEPLLVDAGHATRHGQLGGGHRGRVVLEVERHPG